MTSSAALAAALERALGTAVTGMAGVRGGDINDAFRAELDGRGQVFVKTHRDPPPRFFEVEAAGLRRLAAAGAIRVPEVLAVGEPGGPPFLALEWIHAGAPGPDHDAELGRQLAALHRSGAPRFGSDDGNFAGGVLLPDVPDVPGVPDAASTTWPEYYATCRLEPLVRRTVDEGRLPADVPERYARLASRLPELCGPTEPPALLHGDLWAGNAMTGPSGEPVLVDPGVYGGHREIDLAMMRLFGGFANRTYASYDEHHPLADGYEDRVPLYQLFPLLVHVALFGGGYARATLAALDTYA